jgi:flagellin-like hook-associated protein FlgL
MSRIGATIHGFEQLLLTQLARSNEAAAESSFRLSTGNKYNFPSDDPSAFLQLSLFQNQLSLLTGVRANVDIAANIGASAQTSLDGIRTQLNTIRTALVADEDNTLTTQQKSETQATIDAALDNIRAYARTSINGRRILDGSIDYTYSGQNPSQIKKIDVFSMDDDTVISGTVTSAATQTVRRYTGPGGKISANATITLTGKRGSSTISVINNEDLTTARDRINLDTHLTGIVASVSGNNMDLTTVDYGDAATITIGVNSGTFNTSLQATGADAVATINGIVISNANTDGNRVTYLSNGINMAIEFAAGFSGAFTSVTVSDNNIARFSLSTRINDQTKLGLSALFPEVMGGVSGYLSSLESGGSLSGLGTNSSAAIRVVDEALTQLTSIEARVDAFADITVESASTLLSALETNVEDSIESLNAVDEDEEELLVSKYENLSSNAISAIAILQQQRTNMVGLLQLLAGLN